MNSQQFVDLSRAGRSPGRMRSTACVVFSPERVSSRNALCSASMVSAGKSAPLQAGLVRAEYFRFALGHGVGKRQHVLRDHAIAADDRVPSDAAELVDAARRADHGPIAHMSRGRRASPRCDSTQ